MPDYGIQISNVGSAVIIDSVYKNYTKRYTGTATYSGSGLQTYEVEFDPTLSSTLNPICAIRPTTDGFCWVYFWETSGAPVDTYRGFHIYKTDGTDDIPWICYVEGQTEAVPTWGLVVKNAAGAICWSSDDRWMKVIAEYTGTHTRSKDNYVDVTVQSADNNYFILQSDHSVYATWVFNSPNWYMRKHFRTMKKINSTTIRINCQEIDWVSGGEYTTVDTWDTTYRLVEVGV